MKLGYARVSTADQDLHLQRERLKEAGCEKLFEEKISGACKKRPELELIPVYINNMNRILPRGEVLPVPLLSSITFGPPIWLEAGEPKNEFLARAREAVVNLKDS